MIFESFLSFSFHVFKTIIDDSCVPNFFISGLDPQLFPCIAGWVSVHEYAEVISCATTFIPLRENPTIEPFRVYHDHLIIKDMHFNIYVDHLQTQPFDEIMLYSGWLACGSRLTAPHLPERVMWQFNYTQTIPSHPNVSSPPALTCRRHELRQLRATGATSKGTSVGFSRCHIHTWCMLLQEILRDQLIRRY